MPKPPISICIPTYNRATYLDWQLSQFLYFKEKMLDWEFVISNNGSTDNTKYVVEKYRNELNIIFHEFPENLGYEINFQKAVSLASSEVIARVSDDDFIDIDVINSYLSLFKEHHNLSCIYTPWTYFDAVNEKFDSQFYYQKDELIVYKNDYQSAIKNILENRIFPETFIAKKYVIINFHKSLLNLKNKNIAFPFFELCAYTIKSGDVIFAKIPFYYAITNHPAVQENRTQAGNEILKTAWDSYRGGIEILLGLARIKQNTPQNILINFYDLLNKFILDRMLIALRFNFQSGNFKDCYLIYLRICVLIGSFEIDNEINSENILGLASIELIINCSELKTEKFFLDSEISNDVRELAHKFFPDKFTLDEKKGQRINFSSTKKHHLMSFEEAMEIIRLN